MNSPKIPPSPPLTRAQSIAAYELLLTRGQMLAATEESVLNGLGSWRYLEAAKGIRRWLDDTAAERCVNCQGTGIDPQKRRSRSHAAYRGVKVCSICDGTGSAGAA